MKYTINGVETDDEQKWSDHQAKMVGLKSMLVKHDWYFDHSDDNRAYTKGMEERRSIAAAVRSIGQDADRLFKAYSDIHFNPATGRCWRQP